MEAVFDVASSSVLTDAQKARVMARCGPRVTAVAQDSRSQSRNREIALERLRRRVSAALAVRKPRKATKPSRAAQERRMREKRRQSERKTARKRPVDD